MSILYYLLNPDLRLSTSPSSRPAVSALTCHDDHDKKNAQHEMYTRIYFLLYIEFGFF